ncbi:MAG: terminase small subunit [Rhodospirillaceae bacterium]|nr:terminase small subunit [Rhodospirillaceae bacterium]MDE0616183.1 terminase small subunit [Rhodospirillaceae bacterium]
MSRPLSDNPAETASEASPAAPLPAPPLTQRQEEFCRHYAATGNAAGAARDAGYAAGSARQTGHELLERPAVAARVRAIRAAWRTVEREEAQILLGRLEQAWDAAVEKGSASLMLRVIRLQADLSGLDRRSAHRRAGLWPLPIDVPGEDARPDAGESGAAGPLAEAVRRGRHRTERALAAHRASRRALERRKDFDEAAWLATAQRLHATVEERRPRRPVRMDRRPAPAMTNPDISLHGALQGSAHPAADAPMPDSAPGAPAPTNPDISLHRAGLLPTEAEDRARGPAGVPIAPDRPFFPFFTDADRDDGGDSAEEARAAAAAERQDRDADPEERWTRDMPGAVGILPPAGEPCPIERRAAEEEQDYLKELARTRPPLENRTAGMYLAEFDWVRPCRGEEPDHDGP